MILGVVSDTHNRLSNIAKIIGIFNSNKVDLVIHTGDITKAETLRKFSDLNCSLMCVYGNNDLLELDLKKHLKNAVLISENHLSLLVLVRKKSLFFMNLKQLLKQ